MKERKKVKKLSSNQEKKIAKEVGGRVTIGSGNLWFNKGDVRNKDYLIEAKITGENYYPLSLSTWEKIRKEAILDGLRIPVMCIETNKGKYAILECYDSLSDFKLVKFNKSCRIKESNVKLRIDDNYHLKVIDWIEFLEEINESK